MPKKDKAEKHEPAPQENTRDRLLVYDMPIDLIKQYISISKLFYNNQMWRALQDGMKLLLAEKENKKPEWQENTEKLTLELLRRVDNVEIVLNKLLTEHNQDEKPKETKTFGGAVK